MSFVTHPLRTAKRGTVATDLQQIFSNRARRNPGSNGTPGPATNGSGYHPMPAQDSHVGKTVFKVPGRTPEKRMVSLAAILLIAALLLAIWLRGRPEPAGPAIALPEPPGEIFGSKASAPGPGLENSPEQRGNPTPSPPPQPPKVVHNATTESVSGAGTGKPGPPKPAPKSLATAKADATETNTTTQPDAHPIAFAQRTRARQIGGWLYASDFAPLSSNDRRPRRVIAHVYVGRSGRVDTCKIARSSGDRWVDYRACSLIRRRFRYEPAVDYGGRRMGDVVRWKQDW